MIINKTLHTLATKHIGNHIKMSFCWIVRIDPIKPYNSRAFQWHHDGWGKYVINVMILLSDLSKEGQRMRLCPGL